MPYILILGRQPEISLAELESLYPSKTLHYLPPNVVIKENDLDPKIIHRLGGVLKISQQISIIKSTNISTVLEEFMPIILNIIAAKPHTKFHLGVSAYLFDIKAKDILSLSLNLKRKIKQHSDANIQIAPNSASFLNSAQIKKHKLINSNGLEIILIKKSRETIVAVTKTIQDIDQYSKRDYSRPLRDPKIGMLPPKLAQIIINLATGPLINNYEIIKKQIIYDPFCGTGVILQEAGLMGYKLMGSDIDQRMLDYTNQNLIWLNKKFNFNLKDQLTQLKKIDATQEPLLDNCDFIASEVYLGQPLNNNSSKAYILNQQEQTLQIISDFLDNLKSTLNSQHKIRLCLAIPVWRYNNKLIRLSIIDYVLKLNYNIVKFKLSKNDLIYIRDNQIVGRELLVIET